MKHISLALAYVVNVQVMTTVIICKVIYQAILECEYVSWGEPGIFSTYA